MIDLEHCKAESDRLGENADCTVRACAVATQIPYAIMRDYLAEYGRKPREGMWSVQYMRALTDLGYRVAYIARTGLKAKTVTTLARELNTGTYLVQTRGHVLCLRDGIVHDWTAGRRHRIKSVYRVTEHQYGD